MTKKLIILAYIVGVLVLSGMVKADEVIGHGLVGKVTVDDHNIMDVVGNYPTPCHSKAAVVVSGIDETRHLVHLTVETRVATNMICPAVVARAFAISYDLKELPLTTGATYSLDFGNTLLKEVIQYKAAASTTSADYKINKQDYKGFLVYLGDTVSSNAGYALKKGNQIVPLVSPDMSPELSKYVNHDVHVTGYPVETATLNTASEVTAFGGSSSTVIIPVSISL